MMAVQLLCGAAVFSLRCSVTVLRMLMGTRMPRFRLYVSAVRRVRPVVSAGTGYGFFSQCPCGACAHAQGQRHYNAQNSTFHMISFLPAFGSPVFLMYVLPPVSRKVDSKPLVFFMRFICSFLSFYLHSSPERCGFKSTFNHSPKIFFTRS